MNKYIYKVRCTTIIRRNLLLVILTVGCVGLGQAANDDPKGDPLTSTYSGFSGVFSSTLDSGHRKPGGLFIGETTNTQRLVVTRSNNLASGDQLRGMALIGMDLNSGEPCDGTFGIEYGNKTTLFGKSVSGYTHPHFGDRLSAGYQYWKLRQNNGITASHLIYGRWNHYSRADWVVTAMYGFPRDGFQAVGLLEFRMTDSWPIPGVRSTTRLIPLVRVAHGVNWYGAFQRSTVMALGISAKRNFSRRIRLGLNLECQRRLSGDKTKVLDKTWVSVVADILF